MMMTFLAGLIFSSFCLNEQKSKEINIIIVIKRFILQKYHHLKKRTCIILTNPYQNSLLIFFIKIYKVLVNIVQVKENNHY